MHYVASKMEAGKQVKFNKGMVCGEVSAGHIKHEYTTGYAFKEIMIFFNL